MNADKLKAYHIKKTTEWRAMNPDKKKEIDRKAAARYREKQLEENPEEYTERRRQINRKSAKKQYYERLATMTEEEHKAYLAKRAEDMRKYRERKKAEKLAQQETEKKGTV